MYIMDDGIRLSVKLEMPTPSEGKHPLVIFIHGFTSSKERPHNILSCDAMREAGFAALRMDMYGHGESGGDFQDHTLYKWISNAMAAIDYARKLEWVGDIYLSGHSQGGLVAALAAGMEPDRIKGLILRAPAFLIPRCAREGNMLRYQFDPLRIPEEIPIIKGLTLNGNYIRVAQTIHVEEAIGRFTNPVLILHGDEDDTVPPEDSVAASRQYRNCRLEIIKGETHHFDRYPEEMKSRIREWLQKGRE